MLLNLKGTVENINCMHLEICVFEKQSRHLSKFVVSLCYIKGVGPLPYLGLSCLLFSCCECGCGRASSLCAVAHPSLIWLVFPTLFHSYVMSHLNVLLSAFLLLPCCVHFNSQYASHTLVEEQNVKDSQRGILTRDFTMNNFK